MREHEPGLQEDAKNLSVVSGSAVVAALITIGLFVNKATAAPEAVAVPLIVSRARLLAVVAVTRVSVMPPVTPAS